ncbi:MAG: MarC family protein [Candidatus Sulfotelmatobacter sp.]|jgi:MarC family membrane protein
MTSTHALGQFLRTLPHSAVATFLALFPIVDPFGGIPIFFSMTSSWTAQERRNTALKTGLWVFVILVTFLFFGRFVLHFFGISLPVLKIAGGLIVANTAWGMVTSHARITPEESHEAQGKEDISLTPLAMPLMSGPGAIGVVMALAANVDSAASYFGDGDRHRRDCADCSSFLLVGRAAGAPVGTQRCRSHQQDLRLSDSRHRRPVGVGRRRRLP